MSAGLPSPRPSPLLSAPGSPSCARTSRFSSRGLARGLQVALPLRRCEASQRARAPVAVEHGLEAETLALPEAARACLGLCVDGRAGKKSTSRPGPPLLPPATSGSPPPWPRSFQSAARLPFSTFSRTASPMFSRHGTDRLACTGTVPHTPANAHLLARTATFGRPRHPLPTSAKRRTRSSPDAQPTFNRRFQEPNIVLPYILSPPSPPAAWLASIAAAQAPQSHLLAPRAQRSASPTFPLPP